ncbi:MAG TPA: DUF4240 domain-containing protein [Bacteroidetes bacterium]|nr:DUF4240 domain-containing protein [Bacteroidota bacterium]
MTAVLKLKVEDMDEGFVERLKKAHAKSDIEIHVMNPGESAASLTEEGFWEIIDLLDWAHTGDDEKVLQPAVAYLAEQPLSHIYQFVDMLAKKLFELDTKQHAQVFLDTEGYLSSDDFLYARCAVVANGKKVFESILHNPSEMPTDVTFEPLLHLADFAYQRKTGKKAILKPSVSYETYSNREGWNYP